MASYEERMMAALRFITDHLDEPITLEAMAAAACFSPFHFHRIFTGMMGESVMGHVRRLRLERAAFRLSYGERTILDIALEAGFESHEAFTRAFKAMFSVPPSTYRARTRPADPGERRGFRPVQRIPSPKGGSDMDVEVKRFESVKVACVRHVGPYHECGKAWEKVCAWAGPRGLLGPGCAFMGVCWDDPDVTPEERVRYDACITLAPGAEKEVEGEVRLEEIRGGDYAVTLHRGPFENLHRTYGLLCGVWGPGSGREIAHLPSVEVYLTDPESTPPEELLTEVRIPLENA